MIGIITKTEALQPEDPKVVTGLAGETKEVLPSRDLEGDLRGAVVYRYIQNVGAGNVVFALNRQATALLYHGQLAPGTQASIPALCSVSVYGAGAWSVATTELRRVNA